MTAYWFDVFTRETWLEAKVRDFGITGFSRSKWATVQRVMPGDIFLCYIKGEKKLVGVTRAMGKPYLAGNGAPRIWTHYDFPARVPVEPLVVLDFDRAVGLDSLLPQMSFYEPGNLQRVYARFQGSPTLLSQTDGEVLYMALRHAAGSEPQLGTAPQSVLADPTQYVTPAISGLAEHPETQPEGPRVLTSPVEMLVQELEAAQRDASHPDRFEHAVAAAFAFLGFDTRWIGDAGNTDVVVDSPLGHDRFRAVIDAKASGGGKVAEGHVNFLAINSHKGQTGADHAAVVGERFAGGNLHTFATDSGAALIDTASLIEVLRLHAETPFAAADLRPLLATAGPVTSVLADLRQKAQSLSRHWELVADIIRLVDGFSRADPPLTPTPGHLYAVLVNRALEGRGEQATPPSEQEVREAVTFLSCRAVGVLRLVDPDTSGYRLTMSVPAALQRIQALDRSIQRTWEEVPGVGTSRGAKVAPLRQPSS